MVNISNYAKRTGKVLADGFGSPASKKFWKNKMAKPKKKKKKRK